MSLRSSPQACDRRALRVAPLCLSFCCVSKALLAILDATKNHPLASGLALSPWCELLVTGGHCRLRGTWRTRNWPISVEWTLHRLRQASIMKVGVCGGCFFFIYIYIENKSSYKISPIISPLGWRQTITALNRLPCILNNEVDIEEGASLG